MEDARKAMERFDIKQQFQETEGSVCPYAGSVTAEQGIHQVSRIRHKNLGFFWVCVSFLSLLPPLFFLNIILRKVLSLSQDAQKL